MTRFADLTDAEVAALDDAGVERLIKRAMAEQGIPVLDFPVEPQYLPVPGPDVQVHEIAGCYFDSREAAEDVQSAIAARSEDRVLLRWTSGYDVRHVERDDAELNVTTRMAYSPELYAQHKEVLDRNAELKGQYTSEKSEYDQTQYKARQIKADIMDRVGRIRDRQRKVMATAGRFEEYLDLADGDHLVAWRFLIKAFPLSRAEALSVLDQIPVPTNDIADQMLDLVPKDEDDDQDYVDRAAGRIEAF